MVDDNLRDIHRRAASRAATNALNFRLMRHDQAANKGPAVSVFLQIIGWKANGGNLARNYEYVAMDDFNLAENTMGRRFHLLQDRSLAVSREIEFRWFFRPTSTRDWTKVVREQDGI
ncbi:hypothetical protein PAAG_05844 [Paracoccidioides lutzii Pb01]|uniref:Uncharacterized protein n=1 Tax=Paracoccidioides lutzii (strain ATCC MYA-826 / Pb01) TaxID=502779 RepID=C1H503_PARBA|nr:hypothetical protein PAAG_05844 [Paracoccidioides lutzii Pb01]EEH34797.2 hypothetical protein PAAG_05844 [Paracoccidioides lutzii Pb01]